MESSSREEERRERRDQILARQDEAFRNADRRAMRRSLIIWGAVGAVVLVVAAGLGWAVWEATRPLPGESVADEGRAHVEVGTPIQYETYPPASGPHYPAAAPWEFFDEAIPPGFWVHNLEHGGIVLLYNCQANCDSLKEQLRGLYGKFPTSKYGYPKLVVVPDKQIAGELTALAWDRRLVQITYDEDTLYRFYVALLDQGPEDAP